MTSGKLFRNHRVTDRWVPVALGIKLSIHQDLLKFCLSAAKNTFKMSKNADCIVDNSTCFKRFALYRIHFMLGIYMRQVKSSWLCLTVNCLIGTLTAAILPTAKNTCVCNFRQVYTLKTKL